MPTGRPERPPQAKGLPHIAVAVVVAAAALTACRQDMHNQPRYKPLAGTDFFGDGRSARPVIEDTVARGHLRLDDARFTGKVNNVDVETFPFQMTKADLVRGEERFNIYCSVCHSRVGDGNGMIPRRGFRNPPSYHIDRLRQAPVGHFFDVVTNGFGAMPSYASRIPVDDRWRIIAYVRVLQFSQNAKESDVPDNRKLLLDQPPEQQPLSDSEYRERRETGDRPPVPAPAHKGSDTGAVTK